MENPDKRRKLILSNGKLNKQAGKKTGENFHARRSMLVGSSSGTGDSGRPTENTSGPTLTRNLVEDCLQWKLHLLADAVSRLGNSSGTLVPEITGTEPHAPTAPMPAMFSGFGSRSKRSRSDLQNLPRQGWGGRVLLRNTDAPSMTLMNMPEPLKDRLRGSSAGPKKSLTLVPTPIVHTSGTPVPELLPRPETVLQNRGAPRMHLLSRPRALKEQPQGSSTGSLKSRTSIPAPVVHNFRGINFYKRIGLWTANLWDGKQLSRDGKQLSVGAYLSEAEAARAYDRASLKFFGRDTQLNFQKDDYVKDIEEMAGFDNVGYLKLLRKRAKDPSRDKVVPGVRVCPHGWFEVRIREQVPPKNWQSLGKYSTLEDAKRCYQAKLRSQPNV